MNSMIKGQSGQGEITKVGRKNLGTLSQKITLNFVEVFWHLLLCILSMFWQT